MCAMSSWLTSVISIMSLPVIAADTERLTAGTALPIIAADTERLTARAALPVIAADTERLTAGTALPVIAADTERLTAGAAAHRRKLLFSGIPDTWYIKGKPVIAAHVRSNLC